jgi:hypothetical protein
LAPLSKIRIWKALYNGPVQDMCSYNAPTHAESHHFTHEDKPRLGLQHNLWAQHKIKMQGLLIESLGNLEVWLKWYNACLWV